MTSTGKALQLAQQLAKSQPIRVVVNDSSSSSSTTLQKSKEQASVQYEIPESLKDVPPHLFKFVPLDKMVKQRPFLEFPEWCVPPTENHPNCHFEVIKPEPVQQNQQNQQDQQQFVETKLPPMLINKFPFYLIGNSQSVCDMTMIHPSISRVHLAVVHHQKGVVCICDINSSNGVYLNGKRVAPGSYVPINEGDKIRLGASSRTLVLRLDKSESYGNQNNNNNSSQDDDRQNQNQEPEQQQFQQQVQVPPKPQSPKNNNNNSAQRRDRIETEHQVNQQQNPPQPLAAEDNNIVVAAEKIFPKVHIAHLLILHKDVEKPVSKAARNKGEAIQRSLQDAIDLAKAIRTQLATEPDNGSFFAEQQQKRFIFNNKDVFDQAVKDFSECGTAKKNGDMGVIEQGTLPNLPDFESTALKLEPLEMSDVVVTHLGVHVLLRVPDAEVD
jgi:pSer/pThr/pTyr-binding forkhead associated (FHA) protein